MIQATSLDSAMIGISLVIPLFILFLFLILNNGDRKRLPLPPGPPKLPFIGNMHLLAGPAPHRTLRDLAKKYGPIMHLKLGFVSTIVVSSAEAAKEIMKTHDSVFSNRPKLKAPMILSYNFTDIAFAPYGSYWRQLKKMCTLELLTNKSLESSRSIREQEVARLVRSIADSTSSEGIKLVERIFVLNHNIITKMTFGDKFEEELRFEKAIREGTMLASGFQIGDFFPSLDFVGRITGMKSRLKKIHAELNSIMDKNIQQHIERNKTDKPQREVLADILLRIKDNGELGMPLTTDNIKSVLLDVFIGISDNSSNIVEWTMTEMIRHPNIMAKAQAEVRKVVGEKEKQIVEERDLSKLSYLKMVVKETLRFHPPVPLLLPRESTDRCTINGYEIPSKSQVFINYWAISRDPLSWKDPDVFDPERFKNETKDFKGTDFEFIPFGAGRRICPGILLGTNSSELSLASLLYHFDWKLPHGEKPEDLDMNETFGMSCYRTHSLRLIPILRYPIPAA